MLDTLTVQQVADRLGVHRDTVSRWADEGILPSFRSPGNWRRFRAEDVEAFIAAQATGPEAA